MLDSKNYNNHEKQEELVLGRNKVLTKYRYTQPKYMNAINASWLFGLYGMILVLVITYAFRYYYNLNFVLGVSVVSIASTVILLLYNFLFRSMLLNGKLPLVYKKQYHSTALLGFILWTGTWLFVYSAIFFYLNTHVDAFIKNGLFPVVIGPKFLYKNIDYDFSQIFNVYIQNPNFGLKLWAFTGIAFIILLSFLYSNLCIDGKSIRLMTKVRNRPTTTTSKPCYAPTNEDLAKATERLILSEVEKVKKQRKAREDSKPVKPTTSTGGTGSAKVTKAEKDNVIQADRHRRER